MADSVTEEVPITPGSEDQRSEVEETSVSETLTSFNTNVSMGETGEPTLRHVLDRVCNLHTTTGLEDYLKIMGLTGPEGFAIAEQEDFHGLVPDLGRVAVRKLMILSNYCKVHDVFAQWTHQSPKSRENSKPLAIRTPLAAVRNHRAPSLPLGRKHWF